MGFCAECGGAVPTDARFCPICGAPVAQEATAVRQRLRARWPTRPSTWKLLGAVISIIVTLVSLLPGLTALGTLRTVPDVALVDEPSAYGRVEAAGFTVQEVNEKHPRVTEGSVIPTDPAGNTSALTGYVLSMHVWHAAPVTMYVSRGRSTKPPIGIPNVYDLLRAEAQQRIASAGYDSVIFYNVCCHSVAQGRVRQVILADSSPEIVLVDKDGVTAAASGIRRDQRLAV